MGIFSVKNATNTGSLLIPGPTAVRSANHATATCTLTNRLDNMAFITDMGTAWFCTRWFCIIIGETLFHRLKNHSLAALLSTGLMVILKWKCSNFTRLLYMNILFVTCDKTQEYLAYTFFLHGNYLVEAYWISVISILLLLLLCNEPIYNGIEKKEWSQSIHCHFIIFLQNS